MKRGRRHPFKTMQRRAMDLLRKCKPAPSGCLEYQGRVWSRSGHTQYAVGKRHWSGHRFVYAMLVADPGELHVLHTCDNPRCLNIDHLWLGTQRDNSLDMSGKGRTVAQRRTHCRAGHPYDDENTARYGKNGWRDCKRCNLIRGRMKLGWSREEAESMPPIPIGTPTKRRYIGVKRTNCTP